jgi:hypothetical protein
MIRYTTHVIQHKRKTISMQSTGNTLTLLPRRSRYLADKMWASFGTTIDDDDDADAASSDTSNDEEDDSISTSASATACSCSRDDLPILLCCDCMYSC